MKFYLSCFLLFLFHDCFACTIGISDEVVSVKPKIKNYISKVIIPAYTRAGLDCKLSILPSKRLLTYEDSGKIDVILLRIHTPNLDINYRVFPSPVTFAKKAFYIGKENPSQLGVVRGSAYQEYLVKKHAPNTHKTYSNHTKSIYKMYQTGRIDGFFVLEPYLIAYIENEGRKNNEKIKVDELLYYHFVSKRLSSYHQKIFNELQKLDPDKELNFEAYIDLN